MMRNDSRKAQQLRNVSMIRQFTKHAEGSVLVSFGETKVICTASLVPGVPPFLKDKGQGWITAEYGMLPRSTHSRMQREAAKGKQTGRTQEIQRLIGRSLRAAVDLTKLGENTITIDCDVIQADGGTRTAAITGACVALYDAIRSIDANVHAFKQFIAAISVGMVQGEAALDLNYIEDSAAEVDMNVVMTENQTFIEMQGTAEQQAFDRHQLNCMLDLAQDGINQLIKIQKQTLGL